jgi:hypothetical protein
MPQTVTVELTKPIVWRGVEIAALTLRAPTLADLVELGPMFRVHEMPQMESKHFLEHTAVIAAYVARCVVIEPEDAALLDELCLVDAIALREAAMRLFFASDIAADNLPFLPHHSAKGLRE